jgi:hypothetical protein
LEPKPSKVSKLTGIWQNNQFGYQMTLMLNADGSGEFDGEMIKYTTQANKLSLVQDSQTTVYTYVLQGNSLTLSGGDLDGNIVFTKGGTQNTQAGTESNTTNRSAAKHGFMQNANEVIGVWSGNGESIEFKSNGQCSYAGNTFQYQVSQGHITLITPQGNAMLAYSVKGNQLTLSANGQQFTYTKGAGNVGQAPAQNQTQTDGGRVAQELVGKWCWTNVNTTNYRRLKFKRVHCAEWQRYIRICLRAFYGYQHEFFLCGHILARQRPRHVVGAGRSYLLQLASPRSGLLSTTKTLIILKLATP